MAKAVLQKWWQIYANEKEYRFFVGRDGNSGLVRDKYKWRTVGGIAEQSGLTKAEVEKFIQKYYSAGIVVNNAKDPEKWGYWENVTPDAATKKPLDVAKEDKEDRVQKEKKKK